jgi:hypothetical protein
MVIIFNGLVFLILIIFSSAFIKFGYYLPGVLLFSSGVVFVQDSDIFKSYFNCSKYMVFLIIIASSFFVLFFS